MTALAEQPAEPIRSNLRTHPALARAATTCACLLVIAATVWVGLEVLASLSLVLFPLTVATLLTRALIIPSEWLRNRGWRPAPRAATVLLGFIAACVVAIGLIAPPMITEFSDLGPTVREGITDVEDWLVEDSGFDVSRRDIRDFEDQVSARLDRAAEGSSDRAIEGARLVLELFAGLLLALVLTFFAIKDGPRFQEWSIRKVPEARRPDWARMASAGWAALGGYLRASALLGLLEAVIIGAAMFFAGADLVLPVMLLTFAAAFVPLVGATVAGVAAVLVTLASGGLGPALVVAAVALVVQQLDNELLAPWIYGKSLEMHPAVILLSIATGTALFGFTGTVLAVPVTAVTISILASRMRPLPPEEVSPLVAVAAEADAEEAAEADEPDG